MKVAKLLGAGSHASFLRRVAARQHLPTGPMIRRVAAIAAFAVLDVSAISINPASAQTFTGSVNNTTGNLDTASAVFSLVNGTTLQIVLTNTSTISAYQNPDLLSGIFFDIASAPTLTPVSAIASSIFNPGLCSVAAVCAGSSVNVGNELRYEFSAPGFTSTALTTTARYGIAAVGYSSLTPTFGSAAAFPAGNPQVLGGTPGGLDFSVAGTQYKSATSIGLAGKTPLIDHFATFTLSLPNGVTSLAISNVTFGYGTAPDGSAGGRKVPEPASIGLFGAGAAALTFLRRRRSRSMPSGSFDTPREAVRRDT